MGHVSSQMSKNSYLYPSAIIVLISAFISGCASIVSGTDQTLTFNSEPDGATVTVAGRVVGKTPLSVQIDKDKNQSLSFEKEGYKTHTTQLSTSLDGWFWGNILLGGLLGSTTDAASGAMNEFAPDQYFVTLTPDNSRLAPTTNPRKIKELVIAFSDGIRLELASGGGEKTDAVISLLGTEEGSKEATLKVLYKLAIQNKNDLDFAKSIIDFYDIK